MCIGIRSILIDCYDQLVTVVAPIMVRADVLSECGLRTSVLDATIQRSVILRLIRNSALKLGCLDGEVRMN